MKNDYLQLNFTFYVRLEATVMLMHDVSSSDTRISWNRDINCYSYGYDDWYVSFFRRYLG